MIGRRGRHLRKWRPAAALAFAVTGAIAVLASSCSTQSGLSLLPAPTAKGHSWQWSSRCPMKPSQSRSCAERDPEIGTAELSGDEWNLGGGTATAGGVTMSVDASGALDVRASLPAAPPCTASRCIAPSANTWVRGYPNVRFGPRECDGGDRRGESPALKLPMAVRATDKGLVATVGYSDAASAVTYDVAYDLWLGPTSTTTPCQTNGTLELMVWTDYDRSALLPAAMKVATASIPYAVDGTRHAGSDAWSIYVSNVFSAGKTAPWGGTVWLVLDQGSRVRNGTVSLDLHVVLERTAALLREDYGWANFTSRYYLDSVPFGIEFGPGDASLYGAGPARFTLRVSRFCLVAGVTLSDGGC